MDTLVHFLSSLTRDATFVTLFSFHVYQQSASEKGSALNGKKFREYILFSKGRQKNLNSVAFL